MVAPGPISLPLAGVTWMTAQSWTLAPRRTMMGLKSARITALYQTDAFSSTVTSPMMDAVGAMKAVGWIRGDLPSNEKSGMCFSFGLIKHPSPGHGKGPSVPLLYPEITFASSRRRRHEPRHRHRWRRPGRERHCHPAGRTRLHRDAPRQGGLPAPEDLRRVPLPRGLPH